LLQLIPFSQKRRVFAGNIPGVKIGGGTACIVSRLVAHFFTFSSIQ
jgi:hypothetical protein